MSFRLKVPARINILGNPSDANEGDFATISAAINIYAHAKIEPASGITLEQLELRRDGLSIVQSESFNWLDIPLPYNGRLDLIKGSINRLFRYSTDFQQAISKKGFKLSTWTEVPRQSGLGGSSLFVILTLAALRAFYQLNPRFHNNYVLGELTQRVEAKELGITAGYADRYVPIFGGIAYLDYRGKLYQNQLHQEPYTTYECLDPWVDELPLMAASSGLIRDSGDVHGRMRPKYLEEHNTWQSTGGEKPPMVCFMKTAWETAWRGKIALLQQDWHTFGKLMNLNHKVVNEMMVYCGFPDGAGWANNLLIDTALKNGALGAKLTGAGSGGSVFALSLPENLPSLKVSWLAALEEAGLENGNVFQPQIDRNGLTVTRFEG